MSKLDALLVLEMGPPHSLRCTNEILHKVGLRGKAGYFIYDIGSGGNDHLSAASHLNCILCIYEQDNIKVGYEKMIIGLESMLFVGFPLG